MFNETQGHVEGLPRAEVALVLGSSTGGVGRHVVELAAGLRSRHGVTVYGPVATEELFRFSAVCPFVPIEVGDHPRPLRDLVAAYRLRRRASRVDVVHAHGVRAGALTALALLGRRQHAQLVVSWHNAVRTNSEGRGRGGWSFATVLQRWVVARADLLLAVSPDLVNDLRALGTTRVERALIAFPVGPATRAPEEVRASLEIDPAAAIILAVGRLHPQKNLGSLIAAAELIPISDGRHVVVVIAGDGPMRAPLEAAAMASSADVRLLGYRDDVADLLGAADVVVMPSAWEGWPLAAAQALAAGRPLVATAVGGLPELVGTAGLLVPPDDPSALASAIDQVVSDPDLAAHLGGLARQRAEHLPTAIDVTASVIAAYQSVLGRRQ
jgi:glycosyltransferase involved in cell wall biosynthesis